jgi:hypothetical protein
MDVMPRLWHGRCGLSRPVKVCHNQTDPLPASAEDPSPAGSEGWGQRMVGHDVVGAEPTGHRKCTASLAWARRIRAALTRASAPTATMRANQLRLWFASMPYVLLRARAL